MYQENYENDRPEEVSGEGKKTTGQTGEVNFTLPEPDRSQPAKDRSGDDQSGREMYRNGQPGAGTAYGDGRPGADASYGDRQEGAGTPYGNSRPGMDTPYGNSRPGGNAPYGSSHPGADTPYGSSCPGMNAPYGNSRPGGNAPYGNGQSGMNAPYGNGPYGSQRPYGSGQQEERHYAPWQQAQPGAGKQGKKPKKKGGHPLLEKAAGITAAALLFGVVAGGTISGIGLIADSFTGQRAAAESQTTLAQAETIPPTVSQVPSGSDIPSVTPAITNDVSAIVEKAMPSVVAINSVTEQAIQNWFGQTQIYQGKGSGSGIIVGESDSELLIVTNNHVIEGATELGVVFVDDESVEAHIKGTDSENDLAVIAVALDKIPDSTKSRIAVATLGDSDHLKVGQGVIAIGNALGYGQAVTVGYVSALDREVQTDQQTTRNLLQTDAAINPGNSGGALLNMQGEVIGINSAKYTSTEVEGMGYAIPISKVHDIIDDLMTKKTRVQVEEAKQGYLGIQGQDIDATASNLYDMPQGVYIYKIIEGGAAASSDLKEKDIITRFDGQSVRSMTELKNMLTYYAGGDTIELTVQSLVDGRYVERKVDITLGTKTE